MTIEKPEFTWRISVRNEDQSDIEWALGNALPPMMEWHCSESVWDKVHVRAESSDMMVDVYRYEAPGPFDLTIRLSTPEGADAEQASLALRDKVLQALGGTIWDPQRPPLAEQVPEMKAFECQISIPLSSESAIQIALEKALPWLNWEEINVFGDRIRVWGESPNGTVCVYRDQERGPFGLTIRLRASEGTAAEERYLGLRESVVSALDAKVL